MEHEGNFHRFQFSRKLMLKGVARLLSLDKALYGEVKAARVVQCNGKALHDTVIHPQARARYACELLSYSKDCNHERSQ